MILKCVLICYMVHVPSSAMLEQSEFMLLAEPVREDLSAVQPENYPCKLVTVNWRGFSGHAAKLSHCFHPLSRVEISTLGDMFDPKDSATPGEQAVNVPSFPREVVGTGHVPS